MQKQKMRLKPLLLVLGLSLFVMMGALCPDDTDTPISVSLKVPASFTVNTSNDSYENTVGFDLAVKVDSLFSDTRLASGVIDDISLSGITIKIMNNNSASGTTVSGWVDIGETAESLIRLFEFTDFNLNDGELNPDITEAGMSLLVGKINSLIDADGNMVGSGVPIVVHMQGSATPSPPPNIHFQFRMLMHLSVTGTP